ncbi:MAG: molybdopterin-guanine dinucleotide biosynthesis protein B [Caldimicrobium sp.]
MPLFIVLSGYHNSGKTTLGESIVKDLINKGYKIAVVKSTKENTLLTDKENSDTFRYRRAGAQAVSLFQKECLTLYYTLSSFDKENTLIFLEKLFWDYDLVLLEGFKTLKGIPKIWVLKPEDRIEEIKSLYEGIELFIHPNEKEKLTAYVEKKLYEKSEACSLWVNSQKIFLKHFIQEILKNVILGFLKGLKNIPEKISQIEIKIKK